MYKHIIFIITIVCLPFFLIGQNKDAFLKGILLDNSSGEAIPFATIQIKNRAIGVISNNDGSFRIPKSFQEKGDFIVISSLGYTTKEVLLSDLQFSSVNTIYLHENIEQLSGVTVEASRIDKKRIDANELVRRAIQKIPQNYPSSSFALVGYYRDYQTKKGSYLNLNEAVIEVFDRGFSHNDYKSTRAILYDYKFNDDFARDTITSKPYNYDDKSKIIKNAYLSNQGGNEFTLLRIHDVIRNFNVNTHSYVYVLRKDFIEQHKFKNEPDTFLNGKPLHVVSIYKNDALGLVKGKMYISKNDFAIYKLEYAIHSRRHTLDRTQIAKNKAVNSEAHNESLGPLIFQVNVEYQKFGKYMYPNYISFKNSFFVKSSPKFYLESTHLDSEKQRVALIFNNVVEKSNALKKSKYKVYHEKKRLKIDRIQIDSNKVFLYPIGTSIFVERNKIFNSSNDSINFTLDLKNLRDIQNNILNRSRKYQLTQFREFFVQEIKPGIKAPKEGLFLANNKPLFENQSTFQSKDLEKYWMNTPLKN